MFLILRNAESTKEFITYNRYVLYFEYHYRFLAGLDNEAKKSRIFFISIKFSKRKDSATALFFFPPRLKLTSLIELSIYNQFTIKRKETYAFSNNFDQDALPITTVSLKTNNFSVKCIT